MSWPRCAYAMLACLGIAADAAHALPPEALPPAQATPPPVQEARPLLDPAARLPESGSASEHWDLTARFESGHWLFAHFLITNVGPGDATAVAVGSVVSPDGTHTEFTNGRRRHRWQLSSDQKRLDIGTSHLDLRTRSARYQITKDRVAIDLRFELDGSEPTPRGVVPRGYVVDVLARATPVEGTIRLSEDSEALQVRGRLAAVHTVASESEAELVLRRIEFFSLDADALYLLDLVTPKGRRTSWLSGGPRPDAPVSLSRIQVALQGALPASSKRHPDRYWVPRDLRLGGEVVGGIVLGKVLVERDPLSKIPQPFRWWVSRSTKPLRVWAGSHFEVTLPPDSEQPTLQLQGSGVTAVSFVNQAPQP